MGTEGDETQTGAKKEARAMSSAEKARLETQLADAKKRMEAIVTKNIELENQLLELRRSAGEAVGKQERTVGMTRETLE
jgi:hypothetical protein